jgi:hypothetical protein
MPDTQVKTADFSNLDGPTVWRARVEWETGPSTPTYAVLYGQNKDVTTDFADRVAEAAATLEFTENYDQWVEWLGLTPSTSEDEILDGIVAAIRMRGPSSHAIKDNLKDEELQWAAQEIEGKDVLLVMKDFSWDVLSPYFDTDTALVWAVEDPKPAV